MKETEVTITWSPPDDDAPSVKAYLIERMNAKGVWEKVAEASGTFCRPIIPLFVGAQHAILVHAQETQAE
jgi:hypothetical protein